MNINITTAISNFFSIFQTVYDWLDNFVITIGSISFSLIQLMVSLIVIDLLIWFVFKLLNSD